MHQLGGGVEGQGVELARMQPADERREVRQLELERRHVEALDEPHHGVARAVERADLRQHRPLEIAHVLLGMAREEHLQRRHEAQRVAAQQKSVHDAQALEHRSRLVVERADVLAIDGRRLARRQAHRLRQRRALERREQRLVAAGIAPDAMEGRGIVALAAQVAREHRGGHSPRGATDEKP